MLPYHDSAPFGLPPRHSVLAPSLKVTRKTGAGTAVVDRGDDGRLPVAGNDTITHPQHASLNAMTPSTTEVVEGVTMPHDCKLGSRGPAGPSAFRRGRCRRARPRQRVKTSSASRFCQSLRARPATLDQMRQVHGVGAAKLQKYGAAFMEVLREE
jgi:superfamily II DNA helicase RecQ